MRNNLKEPARQSNLCRKVDSVVTPSPSPPPIVQSHYRFDSTSTSVGDVVSQPSADCHPSPLTLISTEKTPIFPTPTFPPSVPSSPTHVFKILIA